MEDIKKRESGRCEPKSFEEGVQEQNSKEPATEPRERSKAGLWKRLTHPDVCQSALKLPFRMRTWTWNISAGDISVADKGL